MSKQQTAVEWLENELSFMLQLMKFPTVREAFLDAFNQAKQMEKEQIEYAYLVGLIHPLEMEATKQAEQYYEENYGGDHE
jgi:spore coat protein CotF